MTTKMVVHREVKKGAVTLVIAEEVQVSPGDKGYRHIVLPTKNGNDKKRLTLKLA